ncbi:MAG: alanine--glyoxylate aminotransferase family protein, partial [Methanobacteriota archaeon]
MAAALDAEAFKAVTVCWNETSTGLTNPIAEIAKVVKARDAFLIVDGITAVAGLENRMEAWGIDALVMGSQKCLAAPPGLSAVALSKRAYESLHTDTSFYTNLKAHVDALAKQDTPFTPAVPLLLA